MCRIPYGPPNTQVGQCGTYLPSLVLPDDVFHIFMPHVQPEMVRPHVWKIGKLREASRRHIIGMRHGFE
jgi:hypothetical protein